MLEVVDVAEELVLQLGVLEQGDCKVLVGGTRVCLEPRGKVSNVGRYLLNHHPSHLAIPDGLRCLKLPEKGLCKPPRLVVLQEADHCLRKQCSQHTALHDV